MRIFIMTVFAATFSISALTAPAPAASGPCARPMAMQGDMSRADATKMASEHFDQMDADHNGVLTAAERQTRREAMKAQCPRAGKHQGKGGKGAKASADVSKADFIQRIEQVFERMDADRNGVVTQAERKAWHQQQRSARQKNAQGASVPAADLPLW